MKERYELLNKMMVSWFDMIYAHCELHSYNTIIHFLYLYKP